MESILIKDTTREEREKIGAESIGNISGACDGCMAGLSGKTLKKFFPAYYTAEEMEQVIISLLTKWKEEKTTTSIKPDVE